MISSPVFSLKIARSFSLGIIIYSPRTNGLCFEIMVACVHFGVWGRGDRWFAFSNYW